MVGVAIQVQRKHPKKFCIKNVPGPQDPPLEILYVGLFPILKGKEAPNIKNLRGQGSPEEGGFLPKFLMFMLFFGS